MFRRRWNLREREKGKTQQQTQQRERESQTIEAKPLTKGLSVLPPLPSSSPVRPVFALEGGAAELSPTPMLQNIFYLLEQVKKNIVGGVTDTPRDRALSKLPPWGKYHHHCRTALSVIYHYRSTTTEPRHSVSSCIVRPSLHVSISIAL